MHAFSFCSAVPFDMRNHAKHVETPLLEVSFFLPRSSTNAFAELPSIEDSNCVERLLKIAELEPALRHVLPSLAALRDPPGTDYALVVRTCLTPQNLPLRTVS